MACEVDVEQLMARLDIVDTREPVLCALVGESDRRTRILEAAQDLRADGALAGYLLGIKDIIHVDGLPTAAGTQLPPALFAGEEAVCVRRLRDAGAVILGKTVTTEFAYFEPGPTTNPHDPAHTPGGSSSGSAAAVAAGYCEAALGTQTVGSVIRPAAFCGVIGFKPTYGRIPTDGLLICAASVDTIGLFVTDAMVAQRVAAVLVDDWSPVVTGVKRPTLGIPSGSYLEQASPEGLQAFDRQMAQLAELEIQIVRVDGLFDDIAAINERHSLLQAGEMAIQHAPWMETHLDKYRPRTREILLRGRDVAPTDLERARDSRLHLRQRLMARMAKDGVDAWICPAAPGPAPAGLKSTGDPVMNLPWTHAGLPALSLPAGRVGHLPVGLQVVAGFGNDEMLLRWSEVLTSALWPLNDPNPK